MTSPPLFDELANALRPSCDTVFGVMGNGNALFVNALPTCGFRYVPLRHESAAVSAADAYFRVSGGLSIATTSYGAGFTNTLTALAEAVRATVPLILVAGDAPRTGRRRVDVDQFAAAKAVGAQTFLLSGDRPGAIARRAVRYATKEGTPVVLAIPYGFAGEGPTVQDDVDEEVGPPEPDPDDVKRAAALLAAAERPLLLAGRGAWLADSSNATERLARQLNAETATTARAIGFFSHLAKSLGVAGGFGGEDHWRQMQRSDVVVIIGARMSPHTTRSGALVESPTKVIQIDVAPRPGSPDVDLYLRGDARLTVEALLAEVLSLPSRPIPSPDDELPARAGDEGASSQTSTTVDIWSHDHSAGAGGREEWASSGQAPSAGTLDPELLTQELDRILPSDRVVVQDGGHFVGWAVAHLSVSSPDRCISAGLDFQSIGLGLGAAVGAAAARPESLLVLCTGDGGTLMGLSELESVIRVARRSVIVVYNDQAYGAELHQYSHLQLPPGAVDIRDVDFAAIGQAFGATTSTVRRITDLDVVADWLGRDVRGTLLLDCRISKSVVAPWMTALLDHGTGWS